VQVDDDDKSDVDDEEMDSGTKAAPETDGQQSSKDGGDKQSKSVRVLVAAEGKCVCTPSQSLLSVGPLGSLDLSAPHHSSRQGSASAVHSTPQVGHATYEQGRVGRPGTGSTAMFFAEPSCCQVWVGLFTTSYALNAGLDLQQ